MTVQGDGDGWTTCAGGHRHWGRFGAAGLLLRASDPGGVFVLLQHRAPWSHDGDTWGLPGGARDSAESPEAAALRETREETGIEAGQVAVRDRYVDDHGGWAYVTVIADAPARVPTRAQRESVELRWVPEAEVAALPLHSGFAATWPVLQARPAHLVVDAANVVGSRPDGWWRDRAGATGRLLDQLAGLAGRTARLPSGGFAVVRDVVAVVEGAARAVPDRTGVRVLRAAGSGDDDVAAAAAEQPVSVLTVTVTADRGLRARLPAGQLVVGPGWLRRVLDDPPTPGPRARRSTAAQRASGHGSRPSRSRPRRSPAR